MNRILVQCVAVVVLSLLAGKNLLASTPEVAVGDVALGPAPLGRLAPAIASDGTDFFAVWTDSRALQNTLIGTRVTAAGEVLDPTGILISAASEPHRNAFEPRVVWNGSSWVVFWASYSPRTSRLTILAARIDAGGKVLDTRTIAEEGSTGTGMYVASNGSRTVIAYAGPGDQPRAATLDQELNIVRDVALVASPKPRHHFSVAAHATQFAIVWHAFDGPDPSVEGVRLSENGELLDVLPRNFGPGYQPFIATDGVRYVVLSQVKGDGALFWTTRGIDATLSDATAPRVLPDARLLQSPSLFWRNDHYLVVAQRNSDVVLHTDMASVRVDRDGNPASSATDLGDLLAGSVDPQYSAAANSAGKVAGIWMETAPITDPNPYRTNTFTRFFTGGTPVPENDRLLLSYSAKPQYAQELAYGHGVFLAAWREDGGIYATRVTHGGRSLDGRGIALSDVSTSGGPMVGYNGSHFIAAWTTSTGIRLRYISPLTGVASAPIDIATGVDYEISLAVSAEAAYVAWGREGRIVVTRIPHATRVAETPLAVSPEQEAIAGTPQVSWNGTILLVLWVEEREVFSSPPISVPDGIYGARVTASLTLLDTAPLVIADAPERSDGSPSLASDGHDWLVVWNGGGSLLGRHVLADGRLEETATLVTTTGATPRVAFDGTRYVVAWKEYSLERSPLYMAYVPPFGPVTRTDALLIANTDTRAGGFGLAPTGFSTGVAYGRTSFASEHGGVERTFLRMMGATLRRRAVVWP